LSKDLDDIASALKVEPSPQGGKPACIYLGDILSDRFTNNQEAMAKFIYKLSGIDNPRDPGQRVDTGVRFIAGNHDTFPLLDNEGGSIPKDVDTITWGAFANKRLPLDEYKKLLIDCFKAADYSAGVLTTHNGVAKSAVEGKFLVGVGGQRSEMLMRADGGSEADCLAVRAGSPEELANNLNTLFADLVSTVGPWYTVSTDFRPSDAEMTPKALGFSSVPGFRQLHGHNANANEDEEGVTNLNARGGQGINSFMPTATVIEYSPNAT